MKFRWKYHNDAITYAFVKLVLQQVTFVFFTNIEANRRMRKLLAIYFWYLHTYLQLCTNKISLWSISKILSYFNVIVIQIHSS